MLETLRNLRTAVVKEAEALKGQNGQFADDQTRAAFDAKMALVEEYDAQIRQLEAAPAPPAPAAAPSADAIRAEERARITGITDAVRIAGLGAELSASMVGRNLTLDQARAEIFVQLAEKDKQTDTRTGHIGMGEDARDKFLRGAANWLIVKAGMAALVARHTKAEVGAVDPGEFRGLSLVELARETLVRAGRSVSGMDKMRMVGEAFTVRSITQGTSDFTTLLENVMHKVLEAAYGTAPDTWRRFCATSTVSDFRAHNRYRMGAFGSLDDLTEHGEFKSKAISDAEKATITAATRGNIINISRQSIINDDMGAFGRLLSMLGRAAKLTEEVKVYALLGLNSGLGPTQSDTEPLFHANRSNVTTTAALSAAAIDLDRVAMAQQRDPWGNEYLDLRPAILLVPVGLGGQARVINQSQYNPDDLGTGSKAVMKPNLVAGLFQDVVDTPRLSGTRRYLFADPSSAPVFEVAFLEGQESPVLETKDGWHVDGTEMKVRHDFGVAAVDFRGAVTNAG